MSLSTNNQANPTPKSNMSGIESGDKKKGDDASRRQGGGQGDGGDGEVRGAHFRGDDGEERERMPSSVQSIAFNGDKEVFAGWAMQMRLLFQYQGLWDVVEKPLPGPRPARSVIDGADHGAADEVRGVEDEQASVVSEVPASEAQKRKARKAHLMLTVSVKPPELLALLQDVPDGNAHEAWTRLHRHFERNTQANKQNKMAAFYRMSQEPDESVAAYAARVKKGVLALAALGEKVSPSTMRFTFSNGLRDCFSQLRTMLPMIEDKGFEAMVDMAVATESQMELSQQRRAQDRGGQRVQESAHAATAHGDRSTAGPCWRCGKSGHQKANCPQPPPTCTGCGKRGHTAERCWSKGKKPSSDGAASKSEATSLQQAGARQAAAMSAAVEFHDAYATEVVSSSADGWMLDGGASKHFVTSAEPLHNAVKNDAVSIRVASGEVLRGVTEGDLKVTTAAGAVFDLKGVLSHPKITRNLLSVSALCDGGAKVTYEDDKAQVIEKKTGQVVLEAPRQGGIYVVQAVASAAVEETSAAARQLRLWHCRLGHPGEAALKQLLEAGAVEGLEGLKASHGDGLCPGCMHGKAQHAAFGKTAAERTMATRVLWRVHADVCGPLPPTLSGSRYLLLLVDEFTRKIFGFCLARKSDAAGRIVEWCRAAVAEQGVAIVEFHSDGGGEFISRELQQFFQSSGITATTTLPYTPQHNGIAERANRTVLERTRAAMHHAGAHQSLWGEAAQAAIFTRNRGALRVGTKETPDGLWLPHPKAKPSVNGLRVWGCDAWVTTPNVDRGSKLDSKVWLGMLVGYDEKRHGYRVLDAQTHKVAVTRDVRVEESSFKQSAAMVAGQGGDAGLLGFDEEMDRVTFANELKLVQRISLEEHAAKMKKDAEAAAVAAVGRSSLPTLAAPALGTAAAAAAPIPLQSSAAEGPKPAVSQSEMELLLQKYAEHSAAAGGDGAKSAAAAAPPQAGAVAAAPERRVLRPREALVKPSRYAMVEDGDVGAEGAMAAEVLEEAMAAQVAAEAAGALDADPTSYEEAMASPDREHWAKAIEAELTAHATNGTWRLTTLPSGGRAMGFKWVFTRKRDAMGQVVRWKARLVAQGFSQRLGVDVFEVFAPVMHFKSLRCILVVVAVRDLELKQLDVPTAFLNAECKEDVYMKVPTGVVAGQGQVCKLVKTLYGIKQAPREWNIEFNGSIVALGYTRCVSDTCVYVKQSRTGQSIIIPVFVDDAFPACATVDLPEMMADLEVLMKKYKIPSIKDADVLLGMRVTRDRRAGTLKLDQELFAKKLLTVHRMEQCNGADTPAEERQRDSGGGAAAETAAQQMDPDDGTGPVHFGSVVGGLSYLAMSTRPDIAHAVNMLSRAVSAPVAQDWRDAKRVLRNVKKTHHLGLLFGGGGGPRDGVVVLAPSFCDADWAGDRTDRRSTTGYVVKVNGSTVSWASKKQTTVALSSAEAEYMAAGAAVQEMLWVRSLLREMGFEQDGASVLLCDNQAAMAMAANDVHHARTKHIDIRHHFIREHVAAGTVRLEYVASADQQADILTKPLGRVLFAKLRERVLGMQC